jgi:hypothetical protein
VKKALLSLALAVLSVNAAFAVTATAGGTAITITEHPVRLLAEAFPGASSALKDSPSCFEGTAIEDNITFCGEGPGVGPDGETPDNIQSVPGVFSLQTTGTGPVRLDVNCFVTCPPGQSQPFVQSFRLKKEIPGSGKCPGTFAPRTFFQFGGGVRTWWTLIFTQPGTKFTLELTVRCLNGAGFPVLHIDRWVWEVVATFESLRQVINVLHTNAIGTTEVPCIASEDMFIALKDSVTRIEEKITADVPDVVGAQDELFAMEALIISFTAFTDCFVAEEVFSQFFPPSNDIQFGDFGFTGIIDTIENPCACKLLADLEFIALCEGIVTPL